MEERIIVDSRFSAVINAPLEKIDIPVWCFSPPDGEHQECSPADIAANSTATRDVRRMSINVEIIGGSLMVRHYVKESCREAFCHSRFCVRPQISPDGAKSLTTSHELQERCSSPGVTDVDR